jgi:hypothetical protein
MAKKEAPQSLFRRLTRLFRSGPVIKKKIRTADTTIAVADKTKSSGTLLFQKSLAPTYATITANAYNLSERLMRYQDFQEMEYSLAIDTKIATSDGFKTIGELAQECEKNPDHIFIVYSYDHNLKRIVPAFGKQARQTCVDSAWKIKFDNGKEIVASPEHRLMLRDGTYRRVEDLKPGDAMMPFYRKDIFADAKEGTLGYSWIYTMDDRFRGWTKEHQLIAEWVAGRQLNEDEVVHHINFIKTDNRPENLRIMTKSAHDSYHAAINNGVKWAPENREWIEEFKKNHAARMRDNAPGARRDVTFARILETAERVGFSMPAIANALDVTWNLIYERLATHGFSTFNKFVAAYAGGQADSMINNRPGLLTRDLSLELLKSSMTAGDTKRSLCIKLGCTVNVLDKFLARRARMSWTELRSTMGYHDEEVTVNQIKSVRKGGRPRGSNGNSLTFQQICDAYTPSVTLPRLAEKLGANKNTIISRLSQNGFKKFSDFQETYNNCKVVSVEYVGEIPLYDLTVDGYKNFATDSVISHNTPEIAAALDIYADETCAQDEKGRVLHIYSDNEKIREVLEDLFYNTLNTEFNLRSWARNLVKYGDFFLYNDVSPTYGVVSAFPIPVNEIEREENYDRDDPFAVRYRWVTLGNRVLENWEITHFRLLGNDMFLPYGSSIIEPARRIWRQLILIEDAMLVYRVVRAPERRVFYIDVANVPAQDVPLYVEEQRKNLRTNQVIDRSSGRVDLRYNPLCFAANVQIPLLDGRMLRIDELVKEWNEGRRDHETYSLDLEAGGRLVPGKVIWAGKSGTTKQFVRVTLDDGGVINVTPEHRMMLRDGSHVKAKDLRSGDSLMPLHVTYAPMSGAEVSEVDKHCYEKVLDPSFGTRIFTHELIAAHAFGLEVYRNGHISQQGKTIHHVNFDKLNNSTGNLQLITNAEHYVKRSEAMSTMWADPERRERARQNMRYVWSPECQVYVINVIRSLRRFEGLDAFLRRLKSDVTFMKLYAATNAHLAHDLAKSLHKNVVGKFIIADYLNWKAVWAAHHPAALGRQYVNNVDTGVVASDGANNHVVISVELIDTTEDVYSVTVDRWHNLAVGGENAAKGAQSPHGGGGGVGLIFAFQSVDEDYFIPVRGQESGTRIETLAGGQNTAAVEDVAYIQKKLFAALKIPRAYLGYDEMLSSKATLAQEDIRFSRTIAVIQKTILAELNKLAIIHLYAHGYDGDDLQNFTLHLSNPSTVAQQQKLELWRAKFEIGGSAPEGFIDKDFVRKEIWGLNDQECKQIDKNRMKDKVVDAAIESGAGAGGDGGGGGEDLFGGGDEGGGGEEPAGGEETPPEENAGEEPEEETTPGVQLLTSADDNDDDETFGLRVGAMKDVEIPVKAQKQLDRVLYNRSRHLTHGPSKTHMPDFRKMTSTDNRAMEDPYDTDFLKSVVSDPFGESVARQQRLPGDVVAALLSWEKKFPGERGSKNGLIKEDQEINIEIDESIEPGLTGSAINEGDVLIIDDDNEDDES